MTLYTIAGAKGGVGKTTIALNLAAAMTQLGHPAAVVDANLGTPHVAAHLGQPLTSRHIHDVMAGKKTIDESLLLHHQTRVPVLAGSITLKDALSATTEKLTTIAGRLRELFLHTIIDSPSGLNDNARAAMLLGDEVIVVTTSDEPSLIDARKTFELARQIGKPAKMVINDSQPAVLSPDRIPGLVGTQAIGMVPHDPAVRRSLAAKQPVIYSHPNVPASKAILAIARRLIED